jgi:Arc/MetJ-type ribon-helix-helix transcriptional regulator
MTTTAKLAISLPVALAQKARRAVRSGRAASVSAYIAEALEQKVEKDDLAVLLDEMLAEAGGPLTAAERRRAEQELGLKWPRRKKSRRA